jgi:hypothetical protein
MFVGGKEAHHRALGGKDGTPPRANAARMCEGGFNEMETKAVAVLKDRGIEFTLSNVGEAHVSCHL